MLDTQLTTYGNNQEYYLADHENTSINCNDILSESNNFLSTTAELVNIRQGREQEIELSFEWMTEMLQPSAIYYKPIRQKNFQSLDMKKGMEMEIYIILCFSA